MKTQGPQLRIEKTAVRGSLPVSLAAAALFSLGQALLLAPVFPCVTVPVYAVFFFSFALAAGSVLLLRSPVQKWVFPAAVALLLFAFILFFQPLTGGLAKLAGDLTDRVALRTGLLLTGPAAPGANALPAAAVCAAVASLAYAAACVRLRPGLLWPLLAVFAVGVLCGVLPEPQGALCLFAGVVLLLIYKNGARGLWKAAVPAAALLCAFGVLTAVFWQVPFSARRLRARVKEAAHTAAYHSGETAMPEGELTDLGKAVFTDAPALEVTFSVPRETYFRGFTGEAYTGKAWTALDPADTADARDLFYWLHSDGFYADGILAAAYGALGETPGETLRVTKRGACARYAYAPYTAVPEHTGSAGYTGDALPYPSAESTLYACYAGSRQEWQALRARLSATDVPEGARVYLADEKAYRDYAYARYLQIPAQAERTLSFLFTEQKPQTLAEIREAVLAAVGTYLYYNESAVVLNGDNDFLSFVLQQHTGGYSVHYATAAALMFRYFGIPARYVEGYYVSAERAGSVAVGTPLALTEHDAHAWAEYYLEGVGWLPFECTPGYTDAGDDAPPPAADSVYVSDALQRQTRSDAPDQPQKLEPPRPDRQNGAFSPLWLLLLLPASLLAVLLRSRLRCALRRRRLQKLPAGAAVPALYGRLLLLRGAGAATGDGELAKAKQLNEEALFSTHTVGEEQLAQMRAYYVHTLENGKRTWSPPKKARLYWIKGLY